MISASKIHTVLAASAVAVFLAFGAIPSHAEDISDSHLQAARDAIAAIKSTDDFDQILPRAAEALKQQLIQKDPNLQEDIIAIVDQQTLALAPRRAALETEAATDYAKEFSEQELKAIAAFYNSPAGKKLLEKGPEVTRDIGSAAVIWERGVARDLAQAVGKALQAKEGGDTASPAPASDDSTKPQDDSKKQ